MNTYGIVQQPCFSPNHYQVGMVLKFTMIDKRNILASNLESGNYGIITKVAPTHLEITTVNWNSSGAVTRRIDVNDVVSNEIRYVVLDSTQRFPFLKTKED